MPQDIRDQTGTIAGDVFMIDRVLLEEQYQKASPKKPPIRAKVGSVESLIPLSQAIRQGSRLETTSISGLSLEGADISELEVLKCRLINCVFQQCDLAGSMFEDVVFVNCDLSNAIIESAGFRRCEFVNCKFTGASFAGSIFENVYLNECAISLASLFHMCWKSVSVTASDLIKSDMGEMELSQVSFAGCCLTGANFFKTRLLGIDLTTCQIDGIVISDSMTEVCGAKMGIYQAVSFARKLGILVEE